MYMIFVRKCKKLRSYNEIGDVTKRNKSVKGKSRVCALLHTDFFFFAEKANVQYQETYVYEVIKKTNKSLDSRERSKYNSLQIQICCSCVLF